MTTNLIGLIKLLYITDIEVDNILCKLVHLYIGFPPFLLELFNGLLYIHTRHSVLYLSIMSAALVGAHPLSLSLPIYVGNLIKNGNMKL